MNNGGRGTTNRLAGYLMVMSAAILFGFNGNLSRLLFNEGVTPLTLVEFRMLIGGLCLLAVIVVGRRQETEDFAQIYRLDSRFWAFARARHLYVFRLNQPLAHRNRSGNPVQRTGLDGVSGKYLAPAGCLQRIF